MSRSVSRYSCWLILLFLILNACTGVSVKESGPGGEDAYRNRVKALGEVGEWGFAARISLDDGEQGGSGSLQWDVDPETSRLGFHGAMGRGAWQLQLDSEGAVLRQANGEIQTAADVDGLILDRIGWPIPVDALQWWVRGLAAPTFVDDRKIDFEGRLISLDQLGWKVMFDRYNSVDGVELPIRLNATREQYRVKLAISRWRLEAGPSHVN